MITCLGWEAENLTKSVRLSENNVKMEGGGMKIAQKSVRSDMYLNNPKQKNTQKKVNRKIVQTTFIDILIAILILILNIDTSISLEKKIDIVSNSKLLISSITKYRQ